VGITRQCGEVCENHKVSIHSILQNPITKRDDAAFVLITEKVNTFVYNNQSLTYLCGACFGCELTTSVLA
jgi:hypothetical protein